MGVLGNGKIRCENVSGAEKTIKTEERAGLKKTMG